MLSVWGEAEALRTLEVGSNPGRKGFRCHSGSFFLALRNQEEENLFITKQPNKKNCFILKSLSNGGDALFLICLSDFVNLLKQQNRSQAWLLILVTISASIT